MKNRMFNLTIYRMELRRNLKSFIKWSVAVCGILFMGMLFYPSINSGDLLIQVEPIFETPMLKGVLSVFGADITNLSNLTGFYVTYNSLYNILLSCMFASILATNLFAKEEFEKTTDFLFTRPVSRLSIYISKTAVLISYLALLCVLFFATSLVSMEVVKNGAPRHLELSAKDEMILREQVKKYPESIYDAFNIDDKCFEEYSLTYASKLLGRGQSELADMNLDINDMNDLLADAMTGPEEFFQFVLENPERYMKIFSMSTDGREEFIQNIRAEQKEYRVMRENFYSSPEPFLRFIDEEPGLALSQFAAVEGSMDVAVSLLGLPDDYERRIFKKYSINKLAVFCSYIFMLVLCIGALVLFTSLLFKRGSSVIGLAVGFVFLMYFIKSITGIAGAFSETARIIGMISPFTWINTEINSMNYGFEWWRLLLYAGVSAAAFILSAFRLNHKDLLL